jgi:hypothetical protein
MTEDNIENSNARRSSKVVPVMILVVSILVAFRMHCYSSKFTVYNRSYIIFLLNDRY